MDKIFARHLDNGHYNLHLIVGILLFLSSVNQAVNMKVKHYIRILSFTLIIAYCSADISKSNNDFAKKLYTALASRSNNDNVFFSPISVHIVLTLLHQGAKGTTASALQKLLDIASVNKSALAYKNFLGNMVNTKDTSLYFASSIYVQKGYPLKSSFQNVAERYFMAKAVNIDFQKSALAAQHINSWVQEKTQNKIKDIVTPDFIEKESLLLINALYFKGLWSRPFQKISTKTEKFYISSTETVDCQMMHTSEFYSYSENEELDAKILKIPYKKQQMKLIIILPNSRTGIAALEKNLVNENVVSLLTRNMKRYEVELSLPKFEIEISMDLSDPLEELGLGPIFSSKAEFSEMISSGPGLRVSSVFQKAFISINENGTEAGAVSGSTLNRRNLKHPERIMTVDHPFLIFLTYSTKKKPYILFMGKVMHPK